ncbi:hypothetical protein [Dethiobacter alkaliphilus]|uniref:Uncharacterized protein n=1 Tax=Dethiobacter alkaliphilus AHT 1 TaxID=555088 RepID=C0GI13_DETAL|nr:hypothetical protein [Dethiobacter alkaliphilus]EEG77087.1 hypothetical protein DealDRAFT_2122 [Dethiobacter alkaliphilus AHT 1]
MKEYKRQWKESWEFNKQGWRLFRRKVNFRYWFLLWLNTVIAIRLIAWLGFEEASILFHFAVVASYFVISPLALLLWVPQYIKLKKPASYRGIVLKVGEWVGEPYKHNKK